MTPFHGVSNRLADLRHDALASVVVFLVALPLCIGITIASGAPTGSGIVTGIVAGLVVGWLSGCPLQVSGPAAGLTVVVYELIRDQGLEAFGVIVIAAGLIQILWSWLQLGQWFRAVSPAVIHGMLAGIGALIFASQFHIMIDDLPKGSGLDNILSLPSAVWKGLIDDDSTPMNHHLAARIGVLTIGTMLCWNLIIPKRFRRMPAVLMGVSVATIMSVALEIPIQRIEVQDNLLAIIHLPTLQALSHFLDTDILAEALGLAFIASVETLLSASAVDQLHTGARTRYNRELLAQGVGNTLCGFIGSLPMTGVIVRSSANVEAGAKTRASAIFHGAWLLVFVSFLPSVLRFIPTASLGAVLVYTGYKLMNFGVLPELKKHGRGEVVIFFATMGAIVFVNLLTGVIFGLCLALAKLLYTTQNLETFFSRDAAAGKLTLHLQGIATFVSLPRLAAVLETAPPFAEISIDSSSLRHIDHACLNLLQNWQLQHEANHGRVLVDWDKMRGASYAGRHNTRQSTWWSKWLE
ncbi:MAG TPA: SulP family inorganic anion transporter [Chthoniobacterales bacterium]|nr:SulP family inorganic anion transporter [Chthoniobacterales bacterium]